MNPYATHMSVLISCLRRTSGPVLELGGGWYSTAVLNAFAHNGRIVRTIESDVQWFHKLSTIALHGPSPVKSHQMVFAPNYDVAPIDDQYWSVVLIDHEPPGRRGADLARLKGRSELIIAHDTEHDAYNYNTVLGTFKYEFTQKCQWPWTTVVSDTMPLDWTPRIASPPITALSQTSSP